MQEKEPIAQTMDEILINDGRNQYGNEHMVTEKASILATCVYLRKTSYSHACRKCNKTFIDFVAMSVKIMEIKLILNSI